MDLFKRPLLRTCCFSCSTRTGCKIIGYLTIIVDAAVIAILLVALLIGVFIDRPFSDNDSNSTSAGELEKFLDRKNLVRMWEKCFTFLTLTAHFGLDLLVCALLIHGVRKNNFHLHVPFILFAFLWILFELFTSTISLLTKNNRHLLVPFILFAFLWILFELFTSTISLLTKVTLDSWFCFNVFMSVLFCYELVVVLSHYTQLRIADDNHMKEQTTLTEDEENCDVQVKESPFFLDNYKGPILKTFLGFEALDIGTKLVASILIAWDIALISMTCRTWLDTKITYHAHESLETLSEGLEFEMFLILCHLASSVLVFTALKKRNHLLLLSFLLCTWVMFIYRISMLALELTYNYHSNPLKWPTFVQTLIVGIPFDLLAVSVVFSEYIELKDHGRAQTSEQESYEVPLLETRQPTESIV